MSTSGPRTRTFRCFARLWCCLGVFGVFLVVSTSGVNIRPKNSYFSVFCKIVVLSWCFWCFSGGVNIRPENSYFSVFCKIVVLSWCFWCFSGGVNIRCQHPARELVLVSTSGPRTRTFRCFARLWCCLGVFGVFVVVSTSGRQLADNKDVLVRDITTFNPNGASRTRRLQTCNFVVSTSGPRTRTFRCFARLWFCRGVFVVVLLSTCDPRTRTFRWCVL